jgi:large subunit ribosomal protein L5e
VHRDHIYGAHVSEYMEYLMEEDEALYKEQFATYIELGLGPENMEEVLQGVHKVYTVYTHVYMHF